MSEVMKDCGIKLFGKTICLLPDKAVSAFTVPEQSECSSSSSISQFSKGASRGESRVSKQEHDDSINISHEETLTEAATSSDISTDDPNTPNPEKNSSEQSEIGDSDEKTLKKPDKIIPCPRCNSMETKFCYYNNYNVNQPRYFCKNCQRYWTSGGTMRNVPVGSGRRKSKSSLVPNYRQTMISDAQNGVLMFGEPSERSQNCGTNEFYDHSSRSMGVSGFPVAFYPVTPYWAPGSNASPNLGKRSREGKMLFEKENVNGEKKSVLVPKSTLRFDDPNEAAKSSVWSTLGINNGKNGLINGSGLFTTFGSPKVERFGSVNNAVMVLQANPAALSRSVNFQESV